MDMSRIRKLSLLLLALLLPALLSLSGSGVIAANSDWTETGISNYSIGDIEAVNATTAWVAAAYPFNADGPYGGLFLKTTDGGAIWVEQHLPETAIPRSISAVDANIAWATAYIGAMHIGVLRTVDGGANWTMVWEDESSWFETARDICAVDDQNAWMVTTTDSINGMYHYSAVLKTSNGGSTWTPVLNTSDSNQLVRISAPDATTAWALAPGILKKTSNGGTTWQDQMTGTPLSSVKAIDANIAWAAGAGVIARTDDGGANWSTMYSGPAYLFDISVNDPSAIWASGRPGATEGCTIMKSVDGGASWQTLYTSYDNSFLAPISDANALNAWALKGTGNNASILHTTNGGSSAPDISGIYPGSGNTATITGCDFGVSIDSSWVKFGNVEVSSYNSWSDNKIQVVVPEGIEVKCQVTVTTQEGISNSLPFLLTDPLSITSVTPSSGMQFTIGNQIQVNGTGFEAGATVRLSKGSLTFDAYNVSLVSPKELTCTIGLFGVDPGTYDVKVINPGGEEAVLPSAFTVNAACGSGAGTAGLVLGCALGLLSLERGLRRRRPLRKA